MHFCRLLILSLIILTMGCVKSSDFSATINFCNFSPYDTEAVVLRYAGEGVDSPRAYGLAAGTCDSFILNTSSTDRLFYYIRAVDTPSLRHLLSEPGLANDWGGWPVWFNPNSTAFACVDESGNFERLQENAACQTSPPLGLESIIFDKNSEFFLESFDPYICNMKLNIDCQGQPRPVLEWAFLLNKSLAASHRSFEIEQDQTSNHIIPTAVGWEAIDRNGPYNLGIEVIFSYDETPLGSPIQVEIGDVIEEFNGHPVFDRNDLVYYIVRHGVESGYSVPHKMTIKRSGERYTVEGFQLFSKIAYADIFLDESGSCSRLESSALTGALREASFYTNDILGCLEFGRETFITRNRKCEFIVNQVVAAYRQFCPDVTFYATVVGGVFMPGRQIPESMLTHFAFKGMRLPARAMRAITLEGAEEAARAVLTLPPGVLASDNLKFVRDQAALGSAMGVGFTVAFPRGLRAPPLSNIGT